MLEIIPIWAQLIIAIVVAAVIVIVVLALSYTVVPAHEAHIVISRSKGRKFYCSRKDMVSSYWRVPFIQQIAVIPIENVKITVDDITLRDLNYAPFIADVIGWINVVDPLLAAERYGLLRRGIESMVVEVSDIIKAVTRNSSMYWKITDIMQKRRDFSQDVEKNINEELLAWGTEVVELEVIHFKDLPEKDAQGKQIYTVIKDLQARQATVINAETRKLVANQDKEAVMVEATATMNAERTKAETEEAYKVRQMERDENIGKREQEKNEAIAVAKQKANEKNVEAERTMTVGKAEYEKDATIAKAEGDAQSVFLSGEARAKITKVTGEAEGDAIRAKGFADAAATDKRAEALKKYNEAAIGVEIIAAQKDVMKTYATEMSKALQVAKINVYAGGEEKATLFGMPLTAKGGFTLGAFNEIGKQFGWDFQKIAESIGKGTTPIVHKKVDDESKEPAKKPKQK
jgi:flotillin